MPHAINPTILPVVIAVAHNQLATLPEILQKIHELGLPIIVVNDGSTDSTADMLQTWEGVAIGRFALQDPVARGKSAALRDGIRKAIELGFTHAITIDPDRRFFPEDIPGLIELATAHPTAVVLGTRDASAMNRSRLSRMGRWINRWMLGIETGRKISDGLCGFRIYPLALVGKLPCRSGHSGYETEVLTRWIWAGGSIVELPIQYGYYGFADRHRQPWLATLRLAGLHLRLLLTAVNPIHRSHLPPGSAPKRSLIAQFLHWLNPITAWRQVRHDEAARTRFAAGCAAGVFIANLPVYGGQTLLALYTAKRFRLHPASLMAGVHISVPPLGPILIALGIAVGHLILHGSWPSLTNYHLTHGQWRTTLMPMLCEWVIGSIVLGTLMGLITFFLMDLALRLMPDPPEAADASKILIHE